MTYSMPLASSSAARELLGTRFGPSRLVRSPVLSTHTGLEVYLKLENELPTGSFKVRGAFCALWTRTRRTRVSEVVAASTGNHGAAVAWAARELGVGARIFVPLGVNARKAQRIRELGAHLVEVGRGIEDAREAAESYVAEGDAFLLDDATSDDVPAGAGTIGVEVVEQLPGVATLVIPVGDSALVRGVAAAVKSVRADVRVVGVQASGAPAYYRSWKAGRVITTETADTIADGLATTRPTAPNVAGIRTLVDEMVLVTDDELLEAMRLLLGSEGIVAEPAGAASVASLLRGSGSSGPGPVVALITGGNVAPEVAERVAASVSDVPTGR
ncbi:MAG: Pyridoxal-5-phosphate-dependent protein beta subunit [Geminicoccaceae bacterium]|nr:Pyridoxal-5-phosphate-dependent protein beta subunit [Geminicoccaceae bacterium]